MLVSDTLKVGNDVIKLHSSVRERPFISVLVHLKKHGRYRISAGTNKTLE